MASEVYVGRMRSLVTHSLLCVLTLGLYFFVWYGLLASELRKSRGVGAGAGVVLVIFLLVPVLGWFLAFWITAGQVRQVQTRADADKQSSTLIPALWGLVPLVGWTIAVAYLQGGANRAWDRMHVDLENATHRPVTLECPGCSGRFERFINPLLPVTVACPTCGRTSEI